MRTAIVIGATGLVGSHLLQLLLADDRFGKVKVLVRRATGIVHPKLEERVVNFDKPTEWQHLVTGDVLYSAMGTTLKTAGSKEAQYKIDHTYQYETASAAAANGVPVYVLVSAGGADVSSRLFYSRMKGELERDINKLPFRNIHILRPAVLVGKRKEARAGEGIGAAITKVVSYIPGFKWLRPIEGAAVAQAMVNATFDDSSDIHIYDMGAVQHLADRR